MLDLRVYAIMQYRKGWTMAGWVTADSPQQALEGFPPGCKAMDWHARAAPKREARGATSASSPGTPRPR